VWREVIPRRPVEKLKKSEKPSWVSPPLVGLENCCWRRGKCSSNLGCGGWVYHRVRAGKEGYVPFVCPV